MTLYLPDEIDEHGTFVEIGDIVDGVVPHDEFIDEMLVISLSQIEEIVQPKLASPFDLFEVSVIEIVDEILTATAPKSTEDAIVVDDLFDGPVGLVEGASNFVDPPFLFDVLSGFVSRSDDVHDSSFMDLSIFEYLTVSYDDSFSVSNLDPIDQRVSPTTEDVEIDMPCLDPPIVQHHLPLLSHVRLIKQKLRRLHYRWSLQVKEEIQKQLSVGFLSVVEYPEWLANVIHVPKKDSKVRVCVNFRDLNKVNPKDDFPLPHIDMLVESTACHSMLSFMDEFSGYSQVLMAPEDMEKTSFITEWGTYCYRVMPFGLKNA
ncbi:hypothetical protein AAG906_018388 [Vitis piasezkii]